MSRYRATTEPVRTPFGKIYAHVHEDAAGRPIAIRHSSPGKFADSTVDTAMQQFCETVTQILKANAREHWAISHTKTPSGTP